MSTSDYSGRAALNRALDRALGADFRVLLLGQDLADPIGGRFGVTRGLSTTHGPHRVLDLPASVTAMCGAAVGAALEGLIPIVELPAAPVSGAAVDQLANLAVFRDRPPAAPCPTPVFRIPLPVPEAGSGPQLDRFACIPGLKVVQPSTPAEAEQLLLAAIRDPAPCVVLEPVRLYDAIGPRADPAEGTSIADATAGTGVVAEVTIVTCGTARVAAMHAVADLTAEGVEVDVVPLRGLESLDTEAVLRSVARTRRLVLAPGSGASQARYGAIAELAGRELLGLLAAPVEQVAAADPGGPRPVDIAAAVHRVCSYSRSRVPTR
ncbi:transketolase C-terminal domain-containing protein [Amycolatopsis sp. NPDC003865]